MKQNEAPELISIAALSNKVNNNFSKWAKVQTLLNKCMFSIKHAQRSSVIGEFTSLGSRQDT